MSVITKDIIHISDAASCRRWLHALQASPAERLAQLDRLWARLERPDMPADLAVLMLDQARPVHLADLDTRLREHPGAVFPLPASSWEVLHQLLASLRRARDLYKRIHTRLVDDTGVSTRMVIPGSSISLHATLPLARALDYQSRVVREQLLRRVDVPHADWRELLLLARHVRATTFLDEVLPDANPLIKSGTSRALFVYPLLLQAALLPGWGEAEIHTIDRLARQWAGKVGFRIDDGAPVKDNRHGPTLALGSAGSVRLDTQALVRRLRPRMLVLGSQATEAHELRLPRGMSRERMTRLLDALYLRWTDAYRAEQPAAPGATRVRLRIGPPASQRDVDAHRRSSGQTEGQPQAGQPASMSYVYGRYEKDELLKSVMESVKPPGVALEQLMAGADWVIPAGGNGDQIEFHRRSNPPVALGALVTFVDAESDVPRLRLGRVVSLRQALDPVGALARVQRLGVRLWPMPAELVGVRLPDSTFFEDAFLMPGRTGEANDATLIVPAGRWRAGPAMMRTPCRDLRIELGASLERDSGFERVSARIFDPLR